MSVVFRCSKCRGLKFSVSPGSNGLYAEMTCLKCDRHIRSLSKYQAKIFLRQFPASAIEVRGGLSL